MRKPKVTIICKGCKKEFKVNPSVVPYRLYCTKECCYKDKGWSLVMGRKLARLKCNVV